MMQKDRKPPSADAVLCWIPAFAGMTIVRGGDMGKSAWAKSTTLRAGNFSLPDGRGLVVCWAARRYVIHFNNTGNVQFRLKHYGFPIELASAAATKSELDKKVELLYPMCIIIFGSANCGVSVSVKRIVKV
jgi:hypothetical protein